MDVISEEMHPRQVVICWKAIPESNNFIAANSYLKLLTSPLKANEITDRLHDNYEVHYRRPGDILRAAGQYPATLYNSDRQKVMRDINSKLSLSPPLLVLDTHNHKIHIADGYETVAALYFHNPATYIPCRVTPWDSDEERA